MKQLHQQNIDSTSKYLKANYKDLSLDDPQVLVSCKEQTEGRGRSGNQWEQPANSLAFSFTLKPSEEMTLSSLELGVHLSKFFGESIQLKWPNDLLNKDFSKCGGILCQLVEPDILIVGIGINLGKFDSSLYDFPYPIGAIQPERELSDEEFKTLPAEIYQYILDHRLSNQEIISNWNQLCIHLNQQVSIVDGDKSQEGIFTGIDLQGAALISDHENKIHKVMSGSLFIDQK